MKLTEREFDVLTTGFVAGCAVVTVTFAVMFWLHTHWH